MPVPPPAPSPRVRLSPDQKDRIKRVETRMRGLASGSLGPMTTEGDLRWIREQFKPVSYRQRRGVDLGDGTYFWREWSKPSRPDRSGDPVAEAEKILTKFETPSESEVTIDERELDNSYNLVVHITKSSLEHGGHPVEVTRYRGRLVGSDPASQAVAEMLDLESHFGTVIEVPVRDGSVEILIGHSIEERLAHVKEWLAKGLSRDERDLPRTAKRPTSSKARQARLPERKLTKPRTPTKAEQKGIELLKRPQISRPLIETETDPAELMARYEALLAGEVKRSSDEIDIASLIKALNGKAEYVVRIQQFSDGQWKTIYSDMKAHYSADGETQAGKSQKLINRLGLKPATDAYTDSREFSLSVTKQIHDRMMGYVERLGPLYIVSSSLEEFTEADTNIPFPSHAHRVEIIGRLGDGQVKVETGDSDFAVVQQMHDPFRDTGPDKPVDPSALLL